MSRIKTEYSWDSYVEEARVEPFQLKVSADETLLFDNPSGTALISIARGVRTGDLELVLRAITGDQWERVQELLSGAGHAALPKLAEDLMDHFNLYDPVRLQGPGGGVVTRRRPTEIHALLNQGYAIVGEGPASSS